MKNKMVSLKEERYIVDVTLTEDEKQKFNHGYTDYVFIDNNDIGGQSISIIKYFDDRKLVLTAKLDMATLEYMISYLTEQRKRIIKERSASERED